nr:unnamed protein product [Callosobruchus chinensis]
MGVNVPDARCRACRQAPEALMHLLPACRTYAGTAHVDQHNAALRVLYYHLRHSYGIDETPVLPYAPGDIESVVENERCRIYWNYSFPTLELVQANKPDIVLLNHQQKTMFVIEFSAPAEVNIVSKEEEKRTKYQELLGQLRRLWPDYAVSLLVMVIGSLGGMRNRLLSALRVIPVCRATAHILAARMQKAVILGKYFSPSNLLTLYEAQIRPSLQYCSHIWGAAAPSTLSILDAVQRRAIRLIGDPALTCHLQPLSPGVLLVTFHSSTDIYKKPGASRDSSLRAKEDEITDVDILQLRERVRAIEECRVEFENLQAEIEENIDNESDLEKELNERESFENIYFLQISLAQKLVNDNDPSQGSQGPPSMAGPTIQQELLNILLRFRQHKYVVAADIAKMYRQALVQPNERPCNVYCGGKIPKMS